MAKNWAPKKVQIPADWRDRYLSAQQAAFILNESPKTLYNRNSAGTGPIFYKVGGRCKYHGKDLETYIRSNGGTIAS